MRIILPITTVIVILLIWEVGVTLYHIEKWLLPSPSIIIASLWEFREIIIMHSIQTIFETLAGLIIAIFLGVLLAIIMERSVITRNIIKPFLVISQTIPFIVLAPLLIIWLGYGILPKIVVVVLACFFPICMNVYDGFRSIDAKMHKLTRSMGATIYQQLRYITIPATMPYFFSGLRLATTYAVGVAVVSEWLGSERGLGILLLRSAKSYQTESVFAAMIVISLLSLSFVGIVELLARKSIPWHYLGKGKNI